MSEKWERFLDEESKKVQLDFFDRLNFIDLPCDELIELEIARSVARKGPGQPT